MSFTGYLFFRILVALVAIVPFWLLYRISDVSYILIYYIVSYRKAVVINNLQTSFPERTEKEIKEIAKRYFRFMSDLLFEGIKGLSMSKKQIIRRHTVVNIQLLDELYRNNQSLIGVTAHYGNWEWGAFSSGVQLKHRAIAFYKPLSNKFIDNYMRRRRSKCNSTLASIKETNITFADTVNIACTYIMAADQSPSNFADCYWVYFLNKDTPCLHGPEKYARMHNLPVYYIDIQRQKRGYYKLYLTLLTDKPLELEPGKLTGLYMKTLEARINEKPEYWLWSHKRWKRNRLVEESIG